MRPLPDVPLFMRLRGLLYSLGMAECGRNFQITSSAYINSLAGLSFGNDIYIAHNSVLIGVDISIGDEVIVGPNCVVSGGNHQFSNGSFRFAKSVNLPVVIGAGSWVAANCTITGGTILPARSVLAAGAVLTKKFEQENAVYCGIPAKFSHHHRDTT